MNNNILFLCDFVRPKMLVNEFSKKIPKSILSNLYTNIKTCL